MRVPADPGSGEGEEGAWHAPEKWVEALGPLGPLRSEGRSARDGAPHSSQWGTICDLPGADAGARSPRSRAARL